MNYRFVLARFLHPRIYRLGIKEAHHSFGMTYDDDPWSPRSVAYDLGRNRGEGELPKWWSVKS
jgi:hypothetical protein